MHTHTPPLTALPSHPSRPTPPFTPLPPPHLWQVQTLEAALECLHAARGLPPPLLGRHRRQVLKAIQPALNHHKRRVREAARRCANEWYLLSAQP